jgi:hypothetical protein
MKSTEEYVVTIPVYDKSKLTAMLLYMDNGESNKFEFESVNGIMNKTDNFKTHDVEDLMFVFVQGFIRMHEVQYADQHKSANDWIIHQIKNKNLTSNFKNSCGEFCFDATEIDREPDKYSSTGWSAVLINVEKCIPIDCPPNIDAGPSAPSGGLIITIEVDNNSTGGSSDGDGDGNDDGDNDNKPEPKIKDKECEENNMTSEAVDCINSSNMIFPCEEGTTEDVWDEIVSSLCNNASGDGDQNTQIEGPQPGKIDCTDVDVELGEYESITENQMERLSQCFTEDQICELINTEKSELSDEYSNMIIDCWPGWWKFNECEEELMRSNPFQFALMATVATDAYRWQNINFEGQEEQDTRNNSCADAFRHAFWMASMTNTIGIGQSGALLFGEAHECGGSGNDNKMDRRNNLIGISAALDQRPFYGTPNIIADLVCEKLEAGELWILSDPSDNASDLIPSNGCECNN